MGTKVVRTYEALPPRRRVSPTAGSFTKADEEAIKALTDDLAIKHGGSIATQWSRRQTYIIRTVVMADGSQFSIKRNVKSDPGVGSWNVTKIG